MFLPIFLTFRGSQNRPNKCNNRVHEAVFGFKEAGLKLVVTTRVQGLMQSVLYIIPRIMIPSTWYSLQGVNEAGAPNDDVKIATPP